MRETAWVIGWPTEDLYYGGLKRTQGDPYAAVRFARAEDAENVKQFIVEANSGYVRAEWERAEIVVLRTNPEPDVKQISRELVQESEVEFLRRSRQNALLQAAALIDSTLTSRTVIDGRITNIAHISPEHSVERAELLLAEIERRQT